MTKHITSNEPTCDADAACTGNVIVREMRVLQITKVENGEYGRSRFVDIGEQAFHYCEEHYKNRD